MALAKDSFVPLDEYFRMKENSEDLLEYIDGLVYMTALPSTKHQRISSRLQIKLYFHHSICRAAVWTPLWSPLFIKKLDKTAYT